MHTKLTKKQIRVIEDLFANDLNEGEILNKHRIKRTTFNKWLADENFHSEFARRIGWLNLQSGVFIARFASNAAAKLVELTDSESQETARKACLDIINISKNHLNDIAANRPDNNIDAEKLPSKTASKILDIMAKEKISA